MNNNRNNNDNNNRNNNKNKNNTAKEFDANLTLVLVNFSR